MNSELGIGASNTLGEALATGSAAPLGAALSNAPRKTLFSPVRGRVARLEKTLVRKEQATNGSDYNTSRAVARNGSGASPPFFEKKVLPLKHPFPKNFSKGRIKGKNVVNQSALICLIRQIRVLTDLRKR
ncbi:MAG: hypothetical protein IJF84_12170 [Thermoguttaceae bacterium]|nr:hypothetical protein [Thermoguttaceae bacterium]